mmetsp:Transcript_66319/g.186788  ORF Transcript_66319/g.186788 Transcript_66319/m.186788 type:complete len:238 (+) Transcript_66319:442-1155(+)
MACSVSWASEGLCRSKLARRKPGGRPPPVTSRNAPPTTRRFTKMSTSLGRCTCSSPSMSRQAQRRMPAGASARRTGLEISMEGRALTSRSQGCSFSSSRTSMPRIWKQCGEYSSPLPPLLSPLPQLSSSESSSSVSAAFLFALDFGLGFAFARGLGLASLTTLPYVTFITGAIAWRNTTVTSSHARKNASSSKTRPAAASEAAICPSKVESGRLLAPVLTSKASSSFTNLVERLLTE